LPLVIKNWLSIRISMRPGVYRKEAMKQNTPESSLI
jgi:hypothetical protein